MFILKSLIYFSYWVDVNVVFKKKKILEQDDQKCKIKIKIKGQSDFGLLSHQVRLRAKLLEEKK